MNVPNTNKTPGDFRIWCTRKNNFVAANIAAIIRRCSDPEGETRTGNPSPTIHTHTSVRSWKDIPIGSDLGH